MELKPIKNYKKLDIPTQKESKNKILNFLIENKKITIPTIFMLLICNKSFAIMPQDTILLPTPGVLQYEPTPLEKYLTILEDLAIPAILISIISIFIFNIVSNKKYEKILNHDEEKIFKKKKIRNTIILIIILLLVWLLSSFIIYNLF